MVKDNCRTCRNMSCEHAGKDREFVCIGGISCKKCCQTRAAKMRMLTDEEMALMLRDILVEFSPIRSGFVPVPTKAELLKWLQQPAEEAQ